MHSDQKDARVREPETCAALTAPNSQLRPNARLELHTKSTATIAALADTRDASPQTLARVAHFRENFLASNVELVVALGGIGDNVETLTAVYRRLAAKAPWTLVAVPGTQESVSQLRQTVAALAAEGHRIVDGSMVRLIRVGPATIATLPGTAFAERLAAKDGCIYHERDVQALLTTVAALAEPVILATHTPPRQRGKRASDRGPGGIHVGDMMLAKQLERANLFAVVHGVVDEAAWLRPSGRHKRGRNTLMLATGAVDATPLFVTTRPPLAGSALIASIDATHIEWKRLLVGADGAPIATKQNR